MYLATILNTPQVDRPLPTGKSITRFGVFSKIWQYANKYMSAADVRMEIPVLGRSLMSSILSSTSLQMDKTFWGVVSTAVEQPSRRANMVARGDGKLGPWGWLQNPSKPKYGNKSKTEFSYDQASWTQPVFRSVKLSWEWWVLLKNNLGVKPTWLLRETGNLAPRGWHPRIPPNQKTGNKS